MQQLTLQFEGFARTGQPIDAAVAKQRKVKNLVVADQFTTAVMNMRCRAARAKAWLRSHAETMEDSLTCAVLMGAGVFVIYLAAVLQGGAV